MIRRLRECLCVVAVLGVSAALAAPPVSAAPSGANDVTSILGLLEIGAFTGPIVGGTSTTIPLRVSGELVVAFHADSATGCAQMAACGYHGTLMLKASSAEVSILRYTAGGRHVRFAGLVLDPASSSTAQAEFARVIRDGGGVCADAAQPNFGFTSGQWRHRSLVFPLFAGVAALRCAGPTPGDLAAATPRLVVPVTPRAGRRIDARSVKSFASHGFAGTVTSTLVFTVGHPSTQSASSVPRGTHYRRVRSVEESLRVIAAHGALTADVRGTRIGGVCVLLDSCGLTGTLTFTPKPVGADGFLASSGPARLPYRDFLVALGLRPGKPRRQLNSSGLSLWAGGGTVQADLAQGTRCSDSVGLGPGSAYLSVRGSRVNVALTTGGFLLSSMSAVSGRTRCPGPELPAFQALASGNAPRAVLGRRRFTITLRPGGGFADDGYGVTLHGQVSLTFARGRPVSRILREPA